MKKIISISIILTLCNVHQALGAKATLDKSYALQEYGGEFNLDPVFSLYVNEITEDIASVIDPDRSYFTVVLNDMEADTWILPDGTLGITRGLLSLVDDEEELAALIAQQLMLAKSVLAVDRVGPVYGSFQLRKYVGGGYALGEANAALSFIDGQDFDSTDLIVADRWGQDAIAQLGYNPNAFVSLLEKFSEFDKEDNFFRRQPWSKERIQKVKENVLRLEHRMRSRNWKPRSKKFMEKTRALSQTDEAYMFASVSKKRVLWNADLMLEKAIDLMPEKWGQEPSFYYQKAQLLVDRDRCEEASSELNKAFELGANGYHYHLLMAECYLLLGDLSEARGAYEESNRMLPNSRSTMALAELALIRGDRVDAKRYLISLMSSPGALKSEAQDSFVKLDAFDNPRLYFPVLSKVRDNKFYAVVSNQSGLSVNDLEVAFSLIVNGKKLEHSARTGPLIKDSKALIYPGWKVSEQDEFFDLDVKVERVW